MWTYVCISSGKIARHEMAESHENGMFKFWRNCLTLFQSGCAIFSSKKQYVWVPAALPPCQDMTSSEF